MPKKITAVTRPDVLGWGRQAARHPQDEDRDRDDRRDRVPSRLGNDSNFRITSHLLLPHVGT
jgi:hypothetical protein